MLIRNSVYAKAGTESNTMGFHIGEQGDYAELLANYFGPPVSWTQIVLYTTSALANPNAWIGYSGDVSGKTSLFDTASAKQVLTPSSTGVTITSAANGSTYNWASEDSGFNRNDSSGYTYSISRS
jgi:hypothetical protein